MIVDNFTCGFYHPKGCFQSKTLTLKNKNKIFPKFLSPYITRIYKISTPKNARIFGSKLSTRLIIEAVFFCPQLRKSYDYIPNTND